MLPAVASAKSELTKVILSFRTSVHLDTFRILDMVSNDVVTISFIDIYHLFLVYGLTSSNFYNQATLHYV